MKPLLKIFLRLVLNSLRTTWQKTALYAACMFVFPAFHAMSQPVPVTVVNVIPTVESGETAQNGEPSIGIYPSGPSRAIISAFGDDPAGDPYFYTANSGANWTDFQKIQHFDTTVKWSQKNNAYVGCLINNGNDIQVLSSTPPANSAGLTLLSTWFPQTNPDQPWVKAATVGTNDRVYVAHNDLGRRSNRPRNTGSVKDFDKTSASVLFSLNADAPGGGGWQVQQIERQIPYIQDSPAVRVAINGNTVYAAFQRYTARGSINQGNMMAQVVVVRDDNGGNDQFNDLGIMTAVTNYFGYVTNVMDINIFMTNYSMVTPGAAGVTTTNINEEIPGLTGTTLGDERLGGDLSIAVDPSDANKVFVAYARVTGVFPGQPQLHVVYSLNGGLTWNIAGDLPVNTDLPALAVAQNGTIALLYTELTAGGNLMTQITQWTFKQFRNNFTAGTTTTLCTFPNDTPSIINNPYIGDYQDLDTASNNFYGTFSASSDPNLAHFPQGALFQRLFTNTVSGLASNALLPASGTNRLTFTDGSPLFSAGTVTKWRQPPDVVQGLDVTATAPGVNNNSAATKILADDFRCTTNGPITRVTIWGSWALDNVASNVPPNIPIFRLWFWSDSGGLMPANLLWTSNFFLGQYSSTPVDAEDLPFGYLEQFFDPAYGVIAQDTMIWRYTFNIPNDGAFVQTNGQKYWLSVTAYGLNTSNYLFGWKTTPTNLTANAVFSTSFDTNGIPTGWLPLKNPPGTGQNLDLAFALGTDDPYGLSIDPYYFALPAITTNSDRVEFQGKDYFFPTDTNEFLVVATNLSAPNQGVLLYETNSTIVSDEIFIVGGTLYFSSAPFANNTPSFPSTNVVAALVENGGLQDIGILLKNTSGTSLFTSGTLLVQSSTNPDSDDAIPVPLPRWAFITILLAFPTAILVFMLGTRKSKAIWAAA